MKFKFSLGNKDFFLEAEKCDTFWKKFRGLMFRTNPSPLIFVFKRPISTAIHSFFVKQKFLAIWILKNKVVDAKIIKPWVFYIKPKSYFDHLVEVPFKSELDIKSFSSVVRKI